MSPVMLLQESLQTASSPIDIAALCDIFRETKYGCFRDYIIAFIHDSQKIKEPEILEILKQHDLLQTEGLLIKHTTTRDDLNEEELALLKAHAPAYLQSIDYLITKTKEKPLPAYTHKYRHDRWKKLASAENIEAVIDTFKSDDDMNIQACETYFRNTVRKRKEIHALRKTAYAWLVQTSSSLTQEGFKKVAEHYFPDTHAFYTIDDTHYILAWKDQLETLNMRHFICPPQ